MKKLLVALLALGSTTAFAESWCRLSFSGTPGWNPTPWNPNPWDPNPGRGFLSGRCNLDISFNVARGTTPRFWLEVQGQSGEFQRLQNFGRLPFSSGNYAPWGAAFWDDNRNGQGTVIGRVNISIPNWRSNFVWVRAVVNGRQFLIFSGNVNRNYY